MEKGNKITSYTIKIKPLRYIVGGLCCASSFIIPDLCVGLMVGLMVIKPIPLKYQLKEMTRSLSGDFMRCKVRAGFVAEKIKRRLRAGFFNPVLNLYNRSVRR